MNIKVTLGLLLFLILTSCVSNSSSGREDKNSQMLYTASEEGTVDKDRIICQRVRDTSSRIPKKVCYSLREKELMEKNSKEFLKSVKEHAGKAGGAMGGDGAPGTR